ncbi:MAG TPA: hypothetical protein VIK84_02525, partial [Haloplasmataceae bacterium]
MHVFFNLVLISFCFKLLVFTINFYLGYILYINYVQKVIFYLPIPKILAKSWAVALISLSPLELESDLI